MSTDAGICTFCFFCGREVRGKTTDDLTENALRQGWDRFKHDEYWTGERWVCEHCKTRHRVHKQKDKENK